MDAEQEKQALLYGADARSGLTGIAPTPDGVTLWWRRGDETVATYEAFHPFFLVSHPELLDMFKPDVRITELRGGNLYRWRVECDDWAHCDAAVKHVTGIYRQHRSDFEYEPLIRFTDPVNHYLLAGGLTHYRGLDMRDLRVLYLAVRAVAAGGADYADPAQADDRIVLAGLSDGRNFSRVIHLEGGDERALLEALSRELREYDPDIIAGHNLFKGAVSYLFQRAKRYGIKFQWGRDGGAVALRKSRAPAAEKQLEYPRADIAGRSLVDTWFLAQYFDIVKRDMERYDAPYVAGYLDSASRLPDPVAPWEADDL